MASVKRLLMLFIFLEERIELYRQNALAIQRVVKSAFGRRIKGLKIKPETLNMTNNWIMMEATADKVHDDKNVSFNIETVFDLEKSHMVINVYFPETGEIRQKQLSFENIPL